MSYFGLSTIGLIADYFSSCNFIFKIIHYQVFAPRYLYIISGQLFKKF